MSKGRRRLLGPALLAVLEPAAVPVRLPVVDPSLSSIVQTPGTLVRRIVSLSRPFPAMLPGVANTISVNLQMGQPG